MNMEYTRYIALELPGGKNMINSERKHAIKMLTSLYAPQNFDCAVAHMPVDKDDPEGNEFENYLDFLQSSFLVDESSLPALKLQAHRFGYPVFG